MKKQARPTITPGLYAVGDKVRPIHSGEYSAYGYGVIVAIKTIGNPYGIKFPIARINLFFKEDEIRK